MSPVGLGSVGFVPVERPQEAALYDLKALHSHGGGAGGATERAACLDQVQFTAQSLALHRLVRTWGAVSSLFGLPRSKNPAMPNLLAIREALREAQVNLAAMRDRNGVIDMLRSSALRGAEVLIEEAYGLRGDGAGLTVVLEPDMGNALASVSYRYDSRGRMVNQHLHINMKTFTPDTGPNGRNGRPIENDRIIAHELTHAVMGRNMDMRSLPEWFVEGTAEYIAGGAERIGIVLQHLSPQALISRMTAPWVGDNSQYAAGYMAVRYLEEATAEGGGLKAIMAHLSAGETLSAAITHVSEGTFDGVDGFLAHLIGHGAGTAYLRSIDLSGREAGSARSGRGPDVIPDARRPSNQPLRGFQVEWPAPAFSFPQQASWAGLVPRLQSPWGSRIIFAQP